MSKTRKNLIIAAAVVSLLLLLSGMHLIDGLGPGGAAEAAPTAAAEGDRESSTVKEAIVTVTTEWSKPLFLPPGVHLESYLLTPDTWWAIRVNGDKEYTLYPVNWQHDSFRELPDVVSSVEWRILSGGSSKAKLSYRITKKDG
jgi:hypothetical protein